MQEIDRIAEANEHLDRRARQRAAKAAALLELTPEAIKAEEERQRHNAALMAGLEEKIPEIEEPAQEFIKTDDEANAHFFEPVTHTEDGREIHQVPASPIGSRHAERVAEKMQDPEFAEAYEDYDPTDSLSAKLAEALQPVVDGPAEDEPEVIALGRAVFQWILVPAPHGEDNPGGYQLGLQLQVDEQEPGGFAADITQEQLDSWARGKGLQGNRIEHKQFVSALFERFLAVGLNETGNALVYALEQLMLGNDGGSWDLLPGDKNRLDPPTETAVGDADEPYLPESSD